MDKTLLFVYGSMKQGFKNHKRLLNNATFISKAKTATKHTLYPAQHYLFPCAIENPASDKKFNIQGELYSVPLKYIEDVIDIAEGCPTHYYRKTIQTIDTNNSPQMAECYFYNKNNFDYRFPSSEWTKKNETDGYNCLNFCNKDFTK